MTLLTTHATWEKLGLVYVAAGESPWQKTHAYLPTTMMLNPHTIRVFVAFLDADKMGRIGFVDVSAAEPTQVLGVSSEPVLDIGEPGMFDQDGVTPLCLVPYENRLFLYYVGWQRGTRVPYSLLMGLAVSDDNGHHFTRVKHVPVLERIETERLVRSGGHVHYHQGRWKLWYVSGSQFIHVHDKAVPTYNMRYIESSNGVDWLSPSQVCLELEGEDEYGFGRPFIKIGVNGYEMWYSIRTKSKGYRLGYAQSSDGRHWTRRDAAVGIDVSATGWDSEMIHCSCLQETSYGTYLFYNGNRYGETGFGVARLRT